MDASKTGSHSTGRFLGFFRRVFADNAGFESQRYLIKWLFLSSLIGVVAGLSAIAFTWAIEFVTKLSLGRLAGYLPPSPVGEGSTPVMAIARPWLLPLITMLGGAISGIIVFGLAPEAEGHGTDAAIDAVHHKRARIRSRIPPIKLIASAITIGTGGSGGREGPTAQMSAGFGSILADWLGLNFQDRRIAVCVGIGSGIGAIFRAPLGGAVMAAEILYIHDLEVEALIPTLMASIVGYSIYGAFYGYVPIFGNLARLGFDHPFQLVYYALLGILCGLGGLLYDKCFYGTTHLFHRLRWPHWIKPALGGLLVGFLGLVLPGALHTGYGWVQVSMGSGLLSLPLWVVLLLPLAKIIATSLSIGSGGSGGIFGPGMVIGGMLGASFWRITHGFFPQMPNDPTPFVIIGMMSLFGGIAHAPLAVMLMVAEMTGNLSLLAPAMVAVAVSTALVGDHTIYRSQLRTRADSPIHKVRFSFPLLSSLLVRDAMSQDHATVIPADMTALEAKQLLSDSDESAVVVNDNEDVLGILPRSNLYTLTDSASIRSAIKEDSLLLEPEQTLDVALDRMTARGLKSAPVVHQKKVLGQLTMRDVLLTYKSTLEQSVRRTEKLAPDTVMFQVRISKSNTLVGRTLREANLLAHTLIVSITREGQTVFPNAETRLQPDDSLLVMASRESEQALKSFFSGANSDAS
jgi:CIC family chloride channel protein